MNWWWINGGEDGYMGIMTGGKFGEGATISVWNATGAKGPDCGPFNEGGPGYSCVIPFKISTNVTYHYQLVKQNGDKMGQWWGAWISDGKSNKYIGSIRVKPQITKAGLAVDFTETFIFPGCDKYQKSVVVWSQSILDGLYMANFLSFDKTCSDSNVQPISYYRATGG